MPVSMSAPTGTVRQRRTQTGSSSSNSRDEASLKSNVPTRPTPATTAVNADTGNGNNTQWSRRRVWPKLALMTMTASIMLFCVFFFLRTRHSIPHKADPSDSTPWPKQPVENIAATQLLQNNEAVSPPPSTSTVDYLSELDELIAALTDTHSPTGSRSLHPLGARISFRRSLIQPRNLGATTADMNEQQQQKQWGIIVDILTGVDEAPALTLPQNHTTNGGNGTRTNLTAAANESTLPTTSSSMPSSASSIPSSPPSNAFVRRLHALAMHSRWISSGEAHRDDPASPFHPDHLYCKRGRTSGAGATSGNGISSGDGTSRTLQQQLADAKRGIGRGKTATRRGRSRHRVSPIRCRHAKFKNLAELYRSHPDVVWSLVNDAVKEEVNRMSKLHVADSSMTPSVGAEEATLAFRYPHVHAARLLRHGLVQVNIRAAEDKHAVS